MIKFFRHIRKSLLMENKTGKYLKYAIGEIILVVIGILIALQINNWNENNKASKIEHDYLTKFYADISVMHNFYKSLEMLETEVSEAYNGLKYVEGNGKMKVLKADFETTLLTHQRLREFFQSKSTYNEMLANGILARVCNEIIKNKIIELFNRIDSSNNSIPYFRDELGRASKIINEHVLFSYDENYDLTVVYELSEIYTVIPFKNAMVEIIDARADYFHIAKRISPIVTELKTLLEKELQINN